MRLLSIVAGLVLWLIAGVGAVYWVVCFEAFREILVEGVPVYVNIGGNLTPVSGRMVVAGVVLVPAVCGLGGAWLLGSGVDRKGTEAD